VRSRLQARLKGALVTRLARPELCVINTHPVANHDGDWSAANRFYPLHRAELAVLARVVNEAGPRAVVCGDFNVSRESALFGEFMAATGLADAFEGACPATFRADYLPAGATTHCIDFILTAGQVTVESAALVFAGKKEPLGYVSDHIGLRARLFPTPDIAGGSTRSSRRPVPGWSRRQRPWPLTKLAVDHAIDALDSYHVAVNDVHDPVLADTQPVIPAPVERLRRVRVIGQGGDGCADGAHAFLVSHVTAR